MLTLGTQYSLGLDVGQSTVKAVVLGLKGKTVQFVGTRLLDCRAEGLLGPAELREHLPGWLGEAGWRKREITVGIPQYLATTQISDFPPTSDDALRSMVAHEAQQLAGLSDERFVHAYAPLKPGFRRQNPVLIGICRHSAVAERAEALYQDKLRPAEFGVAGVAMANAYLEIYPQALADPTPQLLLDLGTESSTVVVLAQGQLLYLGTLLFGASRFTQALAKHLGVSEGEAEKAKLQARLNLSDASSPIYRTVRTLEAELRTVLDHWRSSEPDDVARRGFGRILLSGGGALLPGLAAYFAQAFTCQAEVIGVKVQGQAEPDPRHLIAYGLALQGLGLGTIRLSMTPEDVLAHSARRRNFRYLVAAAALLTATLCVYSLWTYERLLDKERQLRDLAQKLDTCNQIIPQLEDIRNEMAVREKMLIPLAAKANRNRHFLRAFERLSDVKDTEGWCIYFADYETYRGALGRWGERPAAESGKPEAKAAVAGLAGLGGGDIGLSPRASVDTTRMRAVTDIMPLQGFILGGYTPVLDNQPYKRVREIVDKLNAAAGVAPGTAGRGALSLTVDLIPETERAGHEDMFVAWADLFSATMSQRERRGAPKYKSYLLRVPMRQVDVFRQAPAAAPAK